MDKLIGSFDYGTKGQVKYQPRVVNNIQANDGILGGDIKKTGDTQLTISPCSCLDSKLKTQLYTDSDFVLDMGTLSPNATYHIVLVKLVSDGSVTFRVYDSEYNIIADETISAYRWIDYWQSTPASVLKEGITVKGVKWWGAFLENTISVSAVMPANMTTSIDISVYIPISRCESINVCGVSNAAMTVAMGVTSVSGTVMAHISTNLEFTGPGNVNEWGGGLYENAAYIPVVGNLIWYGCGTGTVGSGKVTLGIHSIKLRR